MKLRFESLRELDYLLGERLLGVGLFVICFSDGLFHGVAYVDEWCRSRYEYI